MGFAEQFGRPRLVFGQWRKAMPLAELVQPQRDKNGPMDRPIGLVTCPNCQVAMPRISLQPADQENLHGAIYRCPRCDAETRRWIKL
jgi:hypothetical protein